MNIFLENTQPIDAVLLWVDGNDLEHQKKIAPYVENHIKINSRKFKTRFNQVDEIKLSVHSILKYAPFIRNIFIVTDNQIPSFLKKNSSRADYSKIKIIDHSEIFAGEEKYLPTFNCRSIETQLYKIPELSELFIYFNDDFMLLNPTNPEDFFVDNWPILRGKWLKYDEDVWYKNLKKRKKKNKTGHKIAQQKAAKLLGFKQYFKFHHTPSPLRKSTFKSFFESNKELETENISYKFRNTNQFTPQGLANHIEIKQNSCVLKKDHQLCYVQSLKKPIIWYKLKLKWSVKNTNVLFLCIQNLPMAKNNVQQYILNWIKKRLGN